jgi:hypothetical protein
MNDSTKLLGDAASYNCPLGRRRNQSFITTSATTMSDPQKGANSKGDYDAQREPGRMDREDEVRVWFRRELNGSGLSALHA